MHPEEKCKYFYSIVLVVLHIACSMSLLHMMSHLQRDSLVFPGPVMFPHHEDWNDFEEVAVTLLYYHDPSLEKASSLMDTLAPLDS
jgi:hypothetical protein